jgi:transcriptional regulator with XRE-family HTH domain
MKRTGENIKALRESHKWTQDELAAQAKTTAAYISQMETGSRKTGPRMMRKLCDAFGVDEQTIRFGARDEQQQEVGQTRRSTDGTKGPDRVLLDEECADLSQDEQIEVRLLLRKWKREMRQK